MSAAHAASYGAGEWSRFDNALLDELDERIGGFAGKTVLNLGVGPGQFTMAKPAAAPKSLGTTYRATTWTSAETGPEGLDWRTGRFPSLSSWRSTFAASCMVDMPTTIGGDAEAPRGPQAATSAFALIVAFRLKHMSSAR